MTDYAIFAQCVIIVGDIGPVMVLFNAVQKKRTFSGLVVLFLDLPIMRAGGENGGAEEKADQYQGEGDPVGAQDHESFGGGGV